MKSVYKMKEERAEALNEMMKLTDRAVAENRGKTADEKKRFNELDTLVSDLEASIREYEIKIELEKKSLDPKSFIRKEEGNGRNEFRSWLESTLKGERKDAYVLNIEEHRADPLLSTSVEKEKKIGSPDLMITPSLKLLEDLGVSVYPNLKGTFVLPILPEKTATWPDETVDVSTADMTPDKMEFVPKRVGITQSITKEMVANVNDDVIDGILSVLTESVWKAVAEKLFDEIDTDCASRISEITGSTVGMYDLTLLEASLGDYPMSRVAYVFRPETKAYLKSAEDLTGEYIWKENRVNGLPAYSSTAVNDEKVYLGDFSKAVICNWDGISILMDPFTEGSKGVVKFTVDGMFDVGVVNPNYFSILSDASTF